MKRSVAVVLLAAALAVITAGCGGSGGPSVVLYKVRHIEERYAPAQPSDSNLPGAEQVAFD